MTFLHYTSFEGERRGPEKCFAPERVGLFGTVECGCDCECECECECEGKDRARRLRTRWEGNVSLRSEVSDKKK